ncbi:hypothetical protein ACI65C_010069 [Semiaphis heraclei]
MQCLPVYGTTTAATADANGHDAFNDDGLSVRRGPILRRDRIGGRHRVIAGRRRGRRRGYRDILAHYNTDTSEVRSSHRILYRKRHIFAVTTSTAVASEIQKITWIASRSPLKYDEMLIIETNYDVYWSLKVIFKYSGNHYFFENGLLIAFCLKYRTGPFQSVNDVENTDDTIENNICDEPEPTSSSNNCNTLDSWITNISNISNISTTSTPIRKFERSSSETKCLSASSFTSSTLSNISTMQTFVDKVTKDEKLKLDSMLAKAIYASGSPLSLLDNIYWKKLFEKIRPAYVLPSSYQLSNKLLDSEVNDERCEEDIIPSVKQCINNDTFWDRIKNLHNFLKPIAYWITRIESDLPQLSIVPEIFVEIKKQYDTCIKNVSCFETEKNVIKNKIQSRKEFSVRQIHLAANVLHPKYRGNNLTADENIEAATFIHRLSTICLDIDEQKVMYDFAQYKLKEEQERQVNPPLAQQDYYEKLLEEFEEDSNNELQLEEIEEDSNNELQLEEIECEDNTKESDCSVISVNLENEEEENSDIDIDSTEIDELMNMISS